MPSVFLGLILCAGVLFIGTAKKCDLLCNINLARGENHISAVRENKKLDYAAQIKAFELYKCKVIDHRPCNYSFLRAVRLSGYKFSLVGEILLADTEKLTAKKVVNAWLHSPKHKAIMLFPKYRDAGYVQTVIDRIYVWIVEFAAPMA